MQRATERFDIYLRWDKGTSVPILDSVNQGFDFFGLSVYELIRTVTVLAADSIHIPDRCDHMMSFYTFLSLGPSEKNSKLLPPNGWMTIEQADVFVVAIIWFLEDLFGEVVGGSYYMAQDRNYPRSVFPVRN